MEGVSAGDEQQHAGKRRRVLCECGRDAVEKVVGPRSPNRGLRYFCCDQFVFFGKKKNYCRFFQWVDQPIFSKEQKREAQASGRQRRKEFTSGERDLQCARKTRSVVRDLEKQCKTIEGLQVNKENFELEIRNVTEKGSPQIQACEVVEGALTDNFTTSQGGIAACCGEDVTVEAVSAAAQTCTNSCVDAEHSRTSPTNTVQPETGRSEAISEPSCISQPNGAASEHVHAFNPNKDKTAKEGDTHLIQTGLALAAVKEANTRDIQTGPVLVEVLKNEDTDQAGKKSFEGDSAFLETPSCFCSKAAVLKTVKSKGPNQGLRFWVCLNSRPFYVQKNKKSNGSNESCKFFRWVDTPLQKSDALKDEERKKKKEARKRKELSILSG